MKIGQHVCSFSDPSLQAAKPRIAFALAAAITAAVEGSVEAADTVARCGGVEALVALLKSGGGQGKKAAAEALQVNPLVQI